MKNPEIEMVEAEQVKDWMVVVLRKKAEEMGLSYDNNTSVKVKGSVRAALIMGDKKSLVLGVDKIEKELIPSAWVVFNMKRTETWKKYDFVEVTQRGNSLTVAGAEDYEVGKADLNEVIETALKNPLSLEGRDWGGMEGKFSRRIFED